MLPLHQNVPIANAVHAIPQRLAFLIAEKIGRRKVQFWQTQLRLRKVVCKVNQELPSHRSYLGGGVRAQSEPEQKSANF